MSTSTILLRLAIIVWGVLCGGVVYEPLAVVPQWTKQPPETLSMWNGPYGLSAKRFWIGIHPLLVLLLAAALGTGWGDEGRDSMLFVLATYLVVLVVTGVWFVPELIKLTQDSAAAIPPDQWRARARRWERLSIARGLVIVVMAWPLLDALARN